MIFIKWIGLIFIVFFEIYFIFFNLKTKKRTGLPIQGKTKEVKIAFVLGFIIFAVTLLSLFIPESYKMFIAIPFLQFDVLEILGCSLFIVGLIIAINASHELGDSWRIGILETQKTTLVQTRIYKFCRNPYFLAYYMIFLACFLITPSIVLLLLVITAIFWFHHMIKNEEKYLEKVHGVEYLNYCKKVGRYLPKIKKE